MIGVHWPEVLALLVLLVLLVLPWVVGFFRVLPDANRRGQPGMLWALLTLPFGWFAVLGYLIVRGITGNSRQIR